MGKKKSRARSSDFVAYLMVVGLRRSNAAAPVPSKRRYRRHDKHRRSAGDGPA